MRKSLCLVLAAALPLLLACDRLAELLDIPDPVKDAAEAEAEGQAIGSACRQTGRSLEDCYTLNPEAQKAAIFTGWKAMNDYMMEHDLKEVPSRFPPPAVIAKPATVKTEGGGEQRP
ncbi:MAG: hypothetical protein LBK55_04875 [Azoarcus sp.]|jgi:hypothetical protein|nr:hypothetical protein [Azoarcus sp.]